MAITPKHTDTGHNKYDPGKDLSNDQRHRFTEIANQAAERRAKKEAMEAAIKESPAPEPKPKKLKKKSRADWPRTIAWTLVIGALWIWLIIITQ